MNYTNAANAPHTIGDTCCCEGGIKSQSMKDLMDETNNLAHSVLFVSRQINGFLFYDDPDDNENACNPSCFRDVLVNTRNELKYALDKLGTIKSMLG